MKSLGSILDRTSPPASAGQEVQRVGEVGQTGRDIQRSGPAASNLGEQAAAQKVKLALGEQAQREELVARGEQTEWDKLKSFARTEEERQEVGRLELQEQRQSQIEGLLNKLTRTQKTLDAKTQAQDVEHLGALVRASDENYLDRLQLEARRGRLENDYAFREALQESIFDAQLDLARDDSEFRKALSASDDEFDVWLAQMDVETANRILRDEARAADRAMPWVVGGTLASGGLKTYAEYQSKMPNADTPSSPTTPPRTFPDKQLATGQREK